MFGEDGIAQQSPKIKNDCLHDSNLIVFEVGEQLNKVAGCGRCTEYLQFKVSIKYLFLIAR